MKENKTEYAFKKNMEDEALKGILLFKWYQWQKKHQCSWDTENAPKDVGELIESILDTVYTYGFEKVPISSLVPAKADEDLEMLVSIVCDQFGAGFAGREEFCKKTVEHWKQSLSVPAKVSDEEIEQMALDKYCSPYGRPNPETYSFIAGYKAALQSKHSKIK